ncbi:MAG: hypothetical protein L3J35_07105 [Bacteroidales bacterium]|nr:hypothetical protein [Bacteroidales bacterium]
MQQLILNKLKDYSLFSNKNNRLILRTLFISESGIKLYLRKKLPKNTSIELYNHKNKKITNFDVLYSENNTIITLKGTFELQTNYFIKINAEKTQVILNPEINGILDTGFFSDDKGFGVHIKNNKAYFKLWSPPAVKVELLLFDENQNKINISKSGFFKNTKLGIWEYSLNPEDVKLKNINGLFYQYKIFAYGKENIALDPYAKSMAIFNSNSEDKIGKGAIIDFKSNAANPSNFKKTYSNFKFIENETDIIAYEINVRDFTIQPGIINENIAGTFKGLIEKIDYLKALSITHVQLMPVNKAYTQNEINRAYTGKSAKESNYNWGYDPMNYFTLEGRYSTNPKNPYSRIYEFKEMVQVLHDAGIGVILDVVFNHTYLANTFENIAPGCYYRLDDNFQISGHTGAGATIESRRKQARKFIIDVLKFYVQEYHIDGFRFDLMSFTDKETMRQIRKEVGLTYNPDNKNELILQGEAWNFTDLKEDAVIKTDFDSLNIGIFNDTFRDALAGNGYQHGFIHGNENKTSRLASAIIGGINTYDSGNLPFNKDVFFNPYNLFAKEAADCLNFFSVHDGLTLWDKINLTVKDKSKKERLRIMKFAYAILFTSQGKIILHGGDEILRTKPLADYDIEKHRAFTSDKIDIEEDSIYFHENSYCSNDYTNMFRWDRLTNEYSDIANELLDYVKGLIKMRQSISAFRFNNKEQVNHNIHFLTADNKPKNVIHSFKSYKLKQLKLKFLNGIPNEKYYLVGEIHKNNPNPLENRFKVNFDKSGNGKIIFTKNEIQDFDLNKWNDDRNLNFKLVKTKGKWDFPEFAYTKFGHNSISPENINKNFEIEIDLSIKDFNNISVPYFNNKNYIAYIIKQKKESESQRTEKKQLIIAHNASSETLTLNIEELNKPDNWKIIVDSKNTGTEVINNSDVKIAYKKATIPRKSSVVIQSK